MSGRTVAFRGRDRVWTRTQRTRGGEVRVIAAEKRVKHATAEAARNAQRLEKVKRHSRRAAGLGELLVRAEPIVRSGADAVPGTSTDAAKRGRKAGRRARKGAKKATAAATDDAEDLTPP